MLNCHALNPVALDISVNTLRGKFNNNYCYRQLFKYR